MRKLPKRGKAPTRLVSLQTSAKRHAKEQYDKGIKEIKFRGYVYACDEVRASLDSLQSGNCVYCEAYLRPVTSGHVDHFRPKGGYTVSKGGKLVQPGYFLQAYIWRNLLLSCPKCNDGHKKNHFPLEDEANRSVAKVDISQEKPLLINPFEENPRDHIRFREDVPYALNGSIKGNATIDVIKLDRPDLNDARRDKLKLIYVLRIALQKFQPGTLDHARVKRSYDSLVRSDGEYSSCIIDYLASGAPDLG